MPTCGNCGADNPEGFRFCGSCGAALADAPPPGREIRKTVTILFSDVTGSTALGERLDPESLRAVMARYFEAMRTVVERHGGTVEKFIGDAVMAVFGIPVLHEDDAVRAVRAATDMLAALEELNAELDRDYGTTLALRIGVNTGEVVTGTEERLATGDAVNLAARLEQAAQPGEALLGPETFRLVRDAVEVAPAAPLELKGKSEPVAAYRLLRVEPQAPGHARRFDAPLVGRERERRLLADTWERTVSEQSCFLFTLLGPAGVGKSRLVSEFLGEVDATVARGRCLSYGEGITYWPVVEVLVQLLGHDATQGAAELGLDERAVTALSALFAEGVPSTPHETAWAVRKVFEAKAAAGPLVVVFDDVHWGQPTFLELVEHVGGLSRGAPILLLCIGRPELLDGRAGWGGGLLNATNVLLEPLAPAEADELIGRLLGAEMLEPSLRDRIREASGGNPLFLEEMLAMLNEDGANGDVAVPPTIQALLAARLDQLDPSERGVLEYGSVEGELFHRGAVQALAPEEHALDERLTTLVRKELVRPDTPTFPKDEAYRFRHLLIRDAAYDALSKATRARLHESFARWLEEKAQDLVELDEIAGYHLEQAYRYQEELGPVDETARNLAASASERLARAGRGALDRRDVAAAENLLERAAALLREDDPQAWWIQLVVFDALFHAGRVGDAAALAAEIAAKAEQLGDESLALHARLRDVSVQLQADPAASSGDALATVEGLVPTLERLDDRAGLAWASTLISRFNFYLGRAAEAEAAAAHALEEAEAIGDTTLEFEAFEALGSAKWWGPAPISDARAFYQQWKARSVGRGGSSASFERMFLAGLLAVEGRFDEARTVSAEAKAFAKELGIDLWTGAYAMVEGDIELMAGDPAAAEQVLRPGFDLLGSLGETGFRSSVGALLAEALHRLGRDEEAVEVLDEVVPIAHADDFDPQGRSRAVKALILARRGEMGEAESLAREAAALFAATDYLNSHADVLVMLAEVLAAVGKDDEARETLAQAHDLYERKGNLVRRDQVRELLAELADPSEAH